MWFSILLRDRDLSSQLSAVKTFLNRNLKLSQDLSDTIARLDEQLSASDGEQADRLSDIRDDYLHESVYLDAARSMAAAALLSPLIESLFVTIFEGLRGRMLDFPHWSAGERSQLSRADFWNPRLAVSNGKKVKNIVSGICQLADSLGLHPRLPENYDRTLAALFSYRNKMFHNGFEWPAAERTDFDRRIRSSQWPDHWFNKSSWGDKPWIFYMSQILIDDCLCMIDQLPEAVGGFVADLDRATESKEG